MYYNGQQSVLISGHPFRLGRGAKFFETPCTFMLPPDDTSGCSPSWISVWGKGCEPKIWFIFSLSTIIFDDVSTFQKWIYPQKNFPLGKSYSDQLSTNSTFNITSVTNLRLLQYTFSSPDPCTPFPSKKPRTDWNHSMKVQFQFRLWCLRNGGHHEETFPYRVPGKTTVYRRRWKKGRRIHGTRKYWNNTRKFLILLWGILVSWSILTNNIVLIHEYHETQNFLIVLYSCNILRAFYTQG